MTLGSFSKTPGRGVEHGTIGTPGASRLSDSIEDFLDSIYLADVDFENAGILEHVRSIERSYKMLKLMENAVNLLRNKHKYGEAYYWILYYTYLPPSAVQKHRRNHRATPAAYSGHQLPHVFPQKKGSD